MSYKKFCVIGLGYFGLNLALRLSEAGAEVLAIDIEQDKVNLIADKVTHAVCMDSTDLQSLRSMGIEDMDAVIVAIGEKFESSIMTSALLQEIGVKNIYNRVITSVHERLLKLMGIEKLLVPEADAAAKLANKLLTPGIIDSLELSKEYGIFELYSPKKFIGKTLLELNVRETYAMNIVTVKKQQAKRGLLTFGEKEKTEIVGIPKPDTLIEKGDILVVFCKESSIKNLLAEEFE